MRRETGDKGGGRRGRREAKETGDEGDGRQRRREEGGMEDEHWKMEEWKN
ncbi:MAG: hypothetical protein JNK20_08065 [Flavipsychrobacter sp.]|nr:hypothetical protein [Flavipsychrobacter sp.]